MPKSSEHDIQNKIIQFITDELGIKSDDIELDTNLGTYGVDSVAASKLVGLLDKDSSLRLSEITVFEFPTIAGLSSEVARMRAAKAA